MSRRYSDAPVNLIARIPTPEQISAARSSKQTWSEKVHEAWGSWVDGLCAELRRLNHTIGSFISRKQAGRRSQDEANEPPVCGFDAIEPVMTPTAPARSLGDRESVQAVRPPDAPVVSPSPVVPVTFTAPEQEQPAVESVTHEDIVMLRTELLAQRQEIVHLSARVQELKSLVASQQQVLMYLGQEMETRQMPILAAALAPPPPKKTRVARAKPSATIGSGSRKASEKPALNL